MMSRVSRMLFVLILLSAFALFCRTVEGDWTPHSYCNEASASGKKCGVTWTNPLSSVLKNSWNGGSLDYDECLWCDTGWFSCGVWDGTAYEEYGTSTDYNDCRQAGCLPSCSSTEEKVSETKCGLPFFTATDEKCCKKKKTFKCLKTQ
mgnify:CR=1 FL=1